MPARIRQNVAPSLLDRVAAGCRAGAPGAPRGYGAVNRAVVRVARNVLHGRGGARAAMLCLNENRARAGRLSASAALVARAKFGPLRQRAVDRALQSDVAWLRDERVTTPCPTISGRLHHVA